VIAKGAFAGNFRSMVALYLVDQFLDTVLNSGKFDFRATEIGVNSPDLWAGSGGFDATKCLDCGVTFGHVIFVDDDRAQFALKGAKLSARFVSPRAGHFATASGTKSILKGCLQLLNTRLEGGALGEFCGKPSLFGEELFPAK